MSWAVGFTARNLRWYIQDWWWWDVSEAMPPLKM